MSFRERFNELLTTTSKTQKEIAGILGVHPSCITQYKKGDTQPTLDILNKIADYFKCSVDYLLGRENEEGNIIIYNKNTCIEKSSIEIIFSKLNLKNQKRAISYCQGLLDSECN